jgi:3-hydroxy-3-methylglutaryl CoA synthase
MFGITGYGVYLPRLRLQRKVIAQATSWFDSSIEGLAKGERTMCNWDEDAITMAVEAGQDCFAGSSSHETSTLIFASTSMPFMQRQNSVVVAEALGLPVNTRTIDLTGSTRAGSSGFLVACDVVKGTGRAAMVVASERRKSKCGSRQEMTYGDGATALQLGSSNVIAEVVGCHSTAVDFIDRYRSEGYEFDVEWEERWIRDEGYHKLVPEAVACVLADAGVEASSVTHFALPSANDRIVKSTAKVVGINPGAVVDNMIDRCGDTGSAQVLLLIASALERAKAGDIILAVGFGQGCDAILLRCTENIESYRSGRGVEGSLSRGKQEENYFKYQSFNGLAKHDLGKRSEVDKVNYLSAQYRNHKLVNGFVGGKCEACGTVQIPKSPYCVNPECKGYNSQIDFPLSDSLGRVVTWTADSMTFDFSPPAYFGLVEFEKGGRLMVDFTEVTPEKFDTGTEVKMHFRVRQIDESRGFRRYFWKAKQVGE